MERRFDTETINSIVEAQLADWPLAKRNFDALTGCKRRRVAVGDLDVEIQFNPARIRSTGADISKEAIAARECFLCRDNRPAEQHAIDVMPGLEMLVNPYPIFPIHFTFPAVEHREQKAPPMAMPLLAARIPDLCIFFNGARAGASAPDHLHLQGVLSRELPIIRLAEKCHSPQGESLQWSDSWGRDLPFRFLSAVIPPEENDLSTLRTLLTTYGGSPTERNGETGDPALVNTYFWIDPSCGLMRGIAIPRTEHRPRCYTATGEEQIMVSPGAIDMAGVIITPREEDFEKLTAEDILTIYSDVSISQ